MRFVRTTQPPPGTGHNPDFLRPDYLFNFAEGRRTKNQGTRYKQFDAWTEGNAVYLDGAGNGMTGLRNVQAEFNYPLKFEPEWRSFDAWAPANAANMIVTSFLWRPYVSMGSSVNSVWDMGGQDGGTGLALYFNSTPQMTARVMTSLLDLGTDWVSGRIYTVVIGRNEAGDTWGWVNGKLMSTGTGATQALSVMSGVTFQAAGSGYARAFGGVVLMTAMYSASPETYGKTLSENPWQVFAPSRPLSKVFLPPAVTDTTKRWHRTPVVRTTQPKGQAEIDWTNPLTRGMNLCVVPWINDGQLKIWDAVNKTWATVNENAAVTSIKGFKDGVAADNVDASDNLGGGWVTTVQASNILSAMVVAQHNVSGTRGPVLAYSSGDYIGFPSGVPTLLVGGTALGEDSAAWPANTTTTLAGRAQSLNYALARDGQIRGRNTVNSYGDSLGSGGPVRVTGLPGGLNYHPTRCFLAAGWNRHLTDSELEAVSRNPWQLFKPDSRLAMLDSLVLEPRYGRPISDVDVGAWQASSGSDLYAMLDEETPDDGDYIFVTSRSTTKHKLTALGDYTPGNNVALQFRGKSLYDHSVKVSIVQGASTEIASITQAMTTTVAQYELQLTAGEIASITDFTDLYLWIESL